MQEICASLITGNTIFKLKGGWKLQHFTRYTDPTVDGGLKKFLMRVSMQFNLSFEFIYKYWNQVYTKHENLFSISLESERKQGRE